MNRILVHIAVPNARRAVAGTMDGLSGQTSEFSVRLLATPGKPSAIWDGIKGYPSGRWWGASQGLAPAIAQTMLVSGEQKKTEAWFVAYDENTLAPLQTNCPAWPASATFAAFLDLIGCNLDPENQGV
jgi:hypothetical protein